MAAQKLPSVRINRKAVDRLESGHPWVFRSDIFPSDEVSAGDTVRVAAQNGKPLGTAHYSSTSQIALRVLSREAIQFDTVFLRARFEAAQALRGQLVSSQNTAYRLIHAEGDWLPGLIIDRYGDYFTVQMLDQGMDRSTTEIVSVLVEMFAPAGIVARNDAVVRTLESLPRAVTVLHGEIPGRVRVSMNGLMMFADLAHGQKTGVFLDQRENYAAAAQYGRGRALDCFTCTGGFALHLAGRCERIEAVDSSGRALETARANADENNITNVEFREADVFDLLTQYARAGRKFDTIVLDPPAFAKSRKQIDAALRGYKDINLRALKLLAPNGVLITCSCSHHVSEADFLGMLAEASLDAGRPLRVFERRMQAQDHPVLLTVPETHYLKCLVVG